MYMVPQVYPEQDQQISSYLAGNSSISSNEELAHRGYVPWNLTNSYRAATTDGYCIGIMDIAKLSFAEECFIQDWRPYFFTDCGGF